METFLFLQFFSFSLLLFLPLQNALSSKNLDTLLQDYAFRALSHPITGVSYDAKVPNNLTGVKVSAMRLTSGSLRTRGVQNYKEFQIPIGVIEEPYVKRLVLVYHNLGNFSEKFYPLVNGYSYLSNVLGLLSYSGVNLSATDLPELDLQASDDKPILIKFTDVKSVPYGSLVKCVYFYLNGSVHFDDVFYGNVCKTVKQGHFSIVVETNNNAPSNVHVSDGNKKLKKNLKVGIIVVLCLIGGCILLMLLRLLIVKVRKMKIKKMEWESDNNEALQLKYVGGTISPVAGSIRTAASIDMDIVD